MQMCARTRSKHATGSAIGSVVCPQRLKNVKCMGAKKKGAAKISSKVNAPDGKTVI